MSKFTQGNWEADDFGEYVFTHAPEGLEPIAQMRGWSYLTGIAGLNLAPEQAIEVQKANARLIAAAPEMYETLQSLVGVLSVHSYSQEEAVKICQLLARIDGKEAANE